MNARQKARQTHVEKMTEFDAWSNCLTRWRVDPSLFFLEALGVRLTNQQDEACQVLRDMVVAKRRKSEGKKLSTKVRKYWRAEYSEEYLARAVGMSIHSGKGLGKDFLAAGLSPYLLLCYNDRGFKGLALAPSAKQLDDVYSAEVGKLMRSSKIDLHLKFDLIKDGLYLLDGKTRTGNFITKRAANPKTSADEQVETLQGLHADYMVFIYDEASGLPDAVFKPLEETLTGYCNFAILIGNVTRSTGWFYRTHYDAKERDYWVRLHWDGEETNLDEVTGHGGHSAFVERMAQKYGKDSNPYRIAVRGLPPKHDAGAVIPMEWIYSAVDRDVEFDETSPKVMGVDVGRGGDDSAICYRQGNYVHKIDTHNSPDTHLTTDWVVSCAVEYDPDTLIIDTSGIGASIYDNLMRNEEIMQLMSCGMRLIGSNFGEAATNNQVYFGRRDEVIYTLRGFFENRLIRIPNDEELIFEASSLKDDPSDAHAGKIKVLSKRKMKAMGLSSPNRVDALALSYSVRGTSVAEREVAFDRYRRKMQSELDSTKGWMTA